jgi:anti-sigma factor RsiW
VTCREFIAFLDDYQAGALDAERRSVFEHHLAECPPCVAYLQTYRKAVDLCKEAQNEPPKDAPADLLKAILAARKK